MSRDSELLLLWALLAVHKGVDRDGWIGAEIQEQSSAVKES